MYLVKEYFSHELTWNCHFANLTLLVKLTSMLQEHQQLFYIILAEDYSVSASLFFFSKGEQFGGRVVPSEQYQDC